MSLALLLINDADPTSAATFDAISPVGEGSTGPIHQWKQLKKNATTPFQSSSKILKFTMLIFIARP